MFESAGVMTRKELEARNEVKWEIYTKKIQIEARVLGDLVMNHVVPVAIEYQSKLIDNTDRNRTSPFAFTGNRFEFRAVGSEANCASAMIALNTAVAEQLTEFKKEVDELIEKGEPKISAIIQVIRKYIKISKPIRFDGNGYSDEWKEEAARRGLCLLYTSPSPRD